MIDDDPSMCISKERGLELEVLSALIAEANFSEMDMRVDKWSGYPTKKKHYPWNDRSFIIISQMMHISLCTNICSGLQKIRDLLIFNHRNLILTRKIEKLQKFYFLKIPFKRKKFVDFESLKRSVAVLMLDIVKHFTVWNRPIEDEELFKGRFI